MLKKILSLFKRSPHKPTEEEIHRDFETASARWIEEVNRADSEFWLLYEEEKRLELFGVQMSELSKKAHAATEELRENTEKFKRIIEYYQKFYPAHSFITDAMKITLCEKHNLKFEYAPYYLGKLSDQNIIAKDFFPEVDDTDAFRFYLIDSVINHYDNLTLDEFKAIRPSAVVRDEDCEEIYMEGDLMKAKIPESNKWLVSRRFKVVKPDFYICAPASDFGTLKGLESCKARHKTTMADPIILKPVRNGFLVVNMLGHRVGDMVLAGISEAVK